MACERHWSNSTDDGLLENILIEFDQISNVLSGFCRKKK